MEYTDKHMQFISIAIDLMNKNGFSKLTLDDVARVAGISTPTLYYYFKNKNEVVKGAISKAMLDARENICISIGKAGSYEAQLENLALALYDSLCSTSFVLDIDTHIKSQLVLLSHDLINDFNSFLCSQVSDILTNASNAGVFHTDDIPGTSAIITETIWALLHNNIATPDFKNAGKKLQCLIRLFTTGLIPKDYKEI